MDNCKCKHKVDRVHPEKAGVAVQQKKQTGRSGCSAEVRCLLDKVPQAVCPLGVVDGQTLLLQQ